MTTDDRAMRAVGRDSLRRLGYSELPEIAGNLLAAVERGHHVAAIAAEGSGREVLYGLAAQRCDPAIQALQAVALAPTREAAGRIALAARELGAPLGLVVQLLPEPEGSRPGGPVPTPHVLVGRPGPLLAEVRAGRLGLGALRLFVVDGAAALAGLGMWDAVEAILDTLPGDAQKVVVSDRLDELLDDLLVRQLHRARRWPPELFGPLPAAAAGAEEDIAPLQCAAASTESGRLDHLEAAVRAGLESPAGSVRVRFSEEGLVSRVAALLETRGLQGHTEEDGSLRFGSESDRYTAILYGTPVGLEALRGALGGGERRVAIVGAIHLRHVELQAARAGWPTQPVPGWSAGTAYDPIVAFRGRIESQIRRGETAAELLVLEPLLAEHGPERVAAALSALLRRGEGEATPLRPWPDVEAVSGLSPAIQPERGLRPAWTKIWIGVGKRDSVRPADLVGAITGEAGIVGGQIGKIDIRAAFSLVDVDSQVVDEVIRKVDGAEIRGRRAVVRLDRGG